MSTPKRLVILGASITALAVARDAHRLGVAPHLVDVLPGPAFESRYPRKLFRQGVARGTLVPEVLGLGSPRDTWVVSTADSWTQEVMNRRREFDAAFARVLHPSNDVLRICLGKNTFADWCDANGFPAARRYGLDPVTLEPLTTVAYPVLVRPALTLHTGTPEGIAKARQAGSAAELATYLARFRAASIEPSVSESLLGRDLDQLSVGVAMIEGRARAVTARKVRPAPEACRVGTLVETVQDSDAEALAVSAMRALEYEGIGEVEILRDRVTGERFLIEINARPWLQFALAPAARRDLLEFLFSDGRSPDPPAPTARLWLDFSGDVWTCFNRDTGIVRNRQISLTQYVRSLVRANVFARWSASDPAPFLRESARLARQLSVRLARQVLARARPIAAERRA